MDKLFAKYKIQIDKELKKFLAEKEKSFGVNPWGADVAKRFTAFIDKGKTVRGGLILFSNEMFGGKIDRNSIVTASAMEILHSALLIHDDIMDRDILRRGVKTLHTQYLDLGKKEKIADAKHFGESLGICAADIGFFWVFELLSTLKVEDDIRQKLIQLFARESVYTGLGQMEDIYYGGTQKQVSEKGILGIYLYKTAHYTFSLPLISGAILAGENLKTLAKLNKLGEYFGTIFQIKDDELGIFGNEKETGKAVGRDIKENKKTLYWLYLNKKANSREKIKLSRIFGNQNLTKADINYLRNLIKSRKVDYLINLKLNNLIDKTKILIDSLPVAIKYKNNLLLFLEYNLVRKK